MPEKESERREEEEEGDEEEEEGNGRKERMEGERDVEKGEMGVEEKVMESKNVEDQRNFHVSMLQRLNPSNPLRIVINSNTRVASPSPSQTSLPRSTPTPQQVSSFSCFWVYTKKASAPLLFLEFFENDF